MYCLIFRISFNKNYLKKGDAMKKILFYVGMFALFFNCRSDAVCKDAEFCFNDFSIETRIGIAPILWTQRGNFSAISCTASSLIGTPTAIITLFELPQFHHLFRIPWIVGGKIGYSLDECHECYFELNYHQAHGKQFVAANGGNGVIVLPNLIDTITFTLAMKQYAAIDWYIGARYFGDWCWCDRLTYFVGGKVGMLHHKKVNFTFTTNSTIVPNPTGPFVSSEIPFFLISNAISGGVNFGLSKNIGCCVDLVITGEVVATCAPKTNALIPFDLCTTGIAINPNLAPNAFRNASLGTEFFFPITIGLYFNF